MKRFEKKLLLAAGLVLFGKGMYELGKRREREEIRENLDELKIKTGEIVKVFEEGES